MPFARNGGWGRGEGIDGATGSVAGGGGGGFRGEKQLLLQRAVSYKQALMGCTVRRVILCRVMLCNFSG